MRLYFLILAPVAWLLWTAATIRELFEPGSAGRTFGWLAIAPTILAHASSAAYLQFQETVVEGRVRDREAFEWLGAQAERNRRKVYFHSILGLGMGLYAMIFWGVGNGYRLWFLVPGMPFHLGAFVAEFAMIVVQERLVGSLDLTST